MLYVHFRDLGTYGLAETVTQQMSAVAPPPGHSAVSTWVPRSGLRLHVFSYSRGSATRAVLSLRAQAPAAFSGVCVPSSQNQSPAVGHLGVSNFLPSASPQLSFLTYQAGQLLIPPGSPGEPIRGLALSPSTPQLLLPIMATGAPHPHLPFSKHFFTLTRSRTPAEHMEDGVRGTPYPGQQPVQGGRREMRPMSTIQGSSCHNGEASHVLLATEEAPWILRLSGKVFWAGG